MLDKLNKHTGILILPALIILALMHADSIKDINTVDIELFNVLVSILILSFSIIICLKREAEWFCVRKKLFVKLEMLESLRLPFSFINVYYDANEERECLKDIIKRGRETENLKEMSEITDEANQFFFEAINKLMNYDLAFNSKCSNVPHDFIAQNLSKLM